MLEHAEQIVKSKKTNKMSIIVRAFRENDYLLNYPRWHYWSEPRLNRTGNSAYFEPFLPYTQAALI